MMWQTVLVLYIVGGVVAFPIGFLMLGDRIPSFAGLWVLCLSWPIWVTFALVRVTMAGTKELWSAWQK